MAREEGRKIAVLGAGAWGTALANLAARGGRAKADSEIVLYARDPDHVAEMAATGVNARRLPGVPLLSNVTPVADLAAAADAEIILAVVPAQALRQLLQQLAPLLEGTPPIVVCAKGIEHGTGRFVTDIVREVLPEHIAAILSGPSFAQDVARGLPTAVTLAARDPNVASALAAIVAGPGFRVYSSSDVRGVEIGGAAKNVLAIASGVAAGRELGASAGAALIARGFAELSRFGRAFEAEAATLMGLSGLGDLVLTCTSPLSRNFSLGLALGRGETIAQATERVGLAEGVFTCGVLVDLASAAGVDMPIANAVDAVLAERITIDEAIAELLARPSKPEG
ncbi:Glycerol-3-phosphate dehydrogenase (NAD(P)(+)) [Methylocella silvestris BL2]|uniref:Glycerol-3-phosphate dehydrogenase [NAD(P)+] n=1 Tax=Methylocella silvestris (strain DSM 15510 / CIP 108128 / LMG 27833 / NCIMB 13906 / BL2) TaxID=395965 RepID=B8ESK4_METSB|nr:NAD(P)H-dependent glycerol-3-phosphate dehydrogenase [Methylocella silvestris]ACK49894.1 Glycerol-3-phosphate dehydrogenase (NAD(P)(+)) [Methylocella silvestris BL2]